MFPVSKLSEKLSDRQNLIETESIAKAKSLSDKEIKAASDIEAALRDFDLVCGSTQERTKKVNLASRCVSLFVVLTILNLTNSI